MKIQYFALYVIGFAVLVTTSVTQSQEAAQNQKSEVLIIDLEHKFSTNQEFKLRGSLQVKPREEYRGAQVNWLDQQQRLSEFDIEKLKESSRSGDLYFLKASLRNHNRTSQTLAKSCSLHSSKLNDIITVNLSPLNEFINVNFVTTDPECIGEVPAELPDSFKSVLVVQSGPLGPSPDTATYIKRLEEERQSKLREGKEDNRSFFAKYWMYIMPAVIILMIFSGPGEQGSGAR